MTHLTTEQLHAGLPHILDAPATDGTLEMVLRRPATDEREVLDVAELSVTEGVVGDNWSTRGSTKTESRAAHPLMQLNLMNCRVTELVSGDRSRWKDAGDQLYVDLDLSTANLPAGTQLTIGTATIEVTEVPHNGCAKFTRRFGLDAHRFVNAKETRHHNLRGINAKVIKSGQVRPGDKITKH